MATVSKKRAKKKKAPLDDFNEDGVNLRLPTKLNNPPSDLADSVIVIYGRKGIGKTSLASRIKRKKKTLVLMLERGRRNLRIYQKHPKSLTEVLGYVELFNDSPDYDTLAIDTADVLHKLCTEHVCAEFGYESIKSCPDRERPTLYTEISSLFSTVFALVQDSGKGLVVVSHEQARELENRKIRDMKSHLRDGKKGEDFDEDDEEEEESAEEKIVDTKFERIQPSCSPAAFREVEQIANFVFYYGYVGRQRTITVRDPGDMVWVSSGDDEHFLDPDGEPINTFAVRNNPDLAYEDLLAAFNNELRDINYVPPRKNKKRRKSL